MPESSDEHPRTETIDGVSRTVADARDWQRTQDDLRAREKELTRALDELAAERRRAPWLRVADDYAFDGPDGSVGLDALFAGQPQLIVYHHMLEPGDADPCAGCGMVGDQIPHLAHLRQRRTELAFVSRAPFGEIESFRRRMGWSMPWYSTRDGFNEDFGVGGGFGVNVFYRRGGDIYRTYFTTGRGVESLGTVWALLDRTPLGRQETWEDAPEGTPQGPAHQWLRLHDDYATE